MIDHIHFQEKPLMNIKRIDCALLPPCRRTLHMKVLRTQYVTSIWKRAITTTPGEGISPTDYGWCLKDGLLSSVWYEGQAIPDNLFETPMEIESENNNSDADNTENADDTDDDAWSEDSDSGDEED